MSSHKPTRLSLEFLESRRTPATLGADGKTVTFTDVDGDAATVKFSKAVLTADNVNAVFTFDTGSVNGDNSARQQLREIDLTGLPAGLSVSVTAPAGGPGDGVVNVGWVNATGKDEGTVFVSGDLGQIVAGDTTDKTPGIKLLNVGSLGVQGTATGAPSLVSTAEGAINTLTVNGSVQTASVNVTGGAFGKIGSVTVGGSLLADPGGAANTGAITASGPIGKVTVVGDVTGVGANSGAIVSYGSIGNVSVGSLTGSGDYSGAITAGGSIGVVKVTGDVTGGSGTLSGVITAVTAIRGVAIGGDLTGSTGAGSGQVLVHAGSIGRVKIAGNLTGGTGDYSGSVNAYDTAVGNKFVGGTITSVSVTGDVTGGGGTYSGDLFASLKIGAVSIGSLTGGSGYDSGTVETIGKIQSVTVHGDVTGGSGEYSGNIAARGALGPVAILGNAAGQNGDLTGGSGQFSAMIRGQTITSVTVAGTVTAGTIEAAGNIGRVKVAGDWIAGSIAAGINPGADGYFGTADDTVTKNATIAGITIGGTVDGTPLLANPIDHFAFTATHIVAVSINGTKVALKPGAGNDNLTVPTTTTGDFTLVELAPI